jgi:WS/DGAT/MGAT family acyltransferase
LGDKIRFSGGRARAREPLDRLSADDVEILKREAGPIRGHTCKVLLIEEPRRGALPTIAQLRASIAARLDAAPRMRQRLTYLPLHIAGPVWLDDPEFHLERHVTAVPTAGPLSREGLRRAVAELMAQRLDPAHPLWQLNVVECLDDGAMALIWRIHHCMADGMTCMRLGAEVLWSDSPDATPPQAPRWMPGRAPSGVSLLVRGLADRSRPRPHRRRSAPTLRSLRASAAVVRRELGPAAAMTALARDAGSARQVAFAAAPFDRCKRAGKAIDPAITLNDVVLALVTGGMRAWLSHSHSPTAGIRAKVPVSLHRADEAGGIANRDSYFFVDLPVAEPDPAERLRAINRETRERKLSHDAETLYRLGAHPFFARWAMSPHVFTFNVSNVPGPGHDVYVLGCRIREMYSLAEIAVHHALRLAVVSAAGSLSFGLCADRDLVQGLDVLAEGIERSADELLSVAG